MSRTVVVLACVAVATSIAPLRAQTASDDPRASGRFEMAIGPEWLGRTSFNSIGAGEPTPSGGQFVLFSSSQQLGSAAGVEGRIGFHMTAALELDAVASYASPALVARVSGDVEASGAAAPAIAVRQFTIGGAMIAHLRRLRIGTRTVPFVEGGGAYLRELYETGSLAVSGQQYHFGGGVSYRIVSRPSRFPRTIGVRGDVRAVVRTSGVATDGRTHVSPAAAGALFTRF